MANRSNADAKGTPEMSASQLLKLTNVSKRFPGTLALDGVDFDLRGGEVHVLFGENGAGKSTLINIIAGTYPPNAGEFWFERRQIPFPGPHAARAIGISSVFQEFSLVPDLSVVQNLFLGREQTRGGFLKRSAMKARAQQLMAELGFDIDLERKVRALSRPHQQMVEIAKALLLQVKLLILDEPTASLTEAESARLFRSVRALRDSGVGVIYVSHRMKEIREIADRITVLRDGRNVASVEARDTTDAALVELMTGRKAGVLYPAITHRPGSVLLQVRGLTTSNRSVSDVCMNVRAGEIVSIAGLVGCGKSELVRAIYGLEPIAEGTIDVDGVRVSRPSPADSLERGVCYFPSDRVAEGLALTRPVRENASIAALDLPEYSRRGFLRKASEIRSVRSVMERLRLRPLDLERHASTLSGGNRQKVVLARGMTRQFGVFLFDEPTVGIDIGAKAELYVFIRDLVENGAAVVLVSSELPEILALSNRVYVLHRGQLVAELAGGEMTEKRVLSHFFPADGVDGLNPSASVS